MRTYKGDITKAIPKDGIILAGTNTQGRSGKGIALWAVQNKGLKYGHIRGICGNTYAIVTKDLTKKIHPSIPGIDIVSQIEELYEYASTINKDFYIPYNTFSTNLNAYTPIQMGYMFNLAGNKSGIPDNIIFEEEFAKLVFNNKL